MRCALFFGSFNPIHFGHLNIARYLLEQCDIEQVRLIVSPKNPLKDASIIADPALRLAQTRKEVSELPLSEELKAKICVSDVEFHLTPPLYTINTLRYIKHSEPENEHILIIGGDNIRIIERWYRWEQILQEFEVWVYPRGGVDDSELCRQYDSLPQTKKVRYLSDAPLYNISSTEIRNSTRKAGDGQ
mgnify:FL=1